MIRSIKHLSALVLLIGYFLSAQSGEDLLSEGQSLIEQGLTDSAEAVLKRAVDINPLFAEAYFQLSRIAIMKYDLDSSGKYLRNAIENDEYNEVYRQEFDRIRGLNSLLGNATRSLNGGEASASISKFEKVMEEYPEFTPPALYYIGLANMRDDMISEAAASFRAAIASDPSYERPRVALKGITDKTYNKGNQSLRRGDYDGAATSFEDVLKLDPEYHRAHFQLGYINTKLGEYGKAIERYQKTVALAPDYAKGWFALALAQQKNGDIDSALKSLDRATETDPYYAKAYSQKGTIHLKMGDYDAAASAYNQAIQADPSYAKAYEDLGKIFVQQKQWSEAVNTLMTATALNGKSAVAWSMLAQAHNAQGSCELAKEAAHESIDGKADFAPALFELAMAEKCLGNKTAALNALEKARKDRSWRKAAEYEIDKIKNPDKFK